VNKYGQALTGILPDRMVEAVRSFLKVYRRTRYRWRQKARPAIVRKGDIVETLRAVGIRKGDGVIVHSSMSKFGQIEGEPRAVVEAIEEVVGTTGTIVMPAFPLKGKMKEHLLRGERFDVSNTPSTMGAITEYFRTISGVCRSVHPTHSVCAKGRFAEEIVAGHELCVTPFAKGSPFDSLVDRNFWILLFGVDFGPLTTYHVFEDRLGPRFPHKVYLDEVHKVPCTRADGSEVIVSTVCHDPELSMMRIDNNKSKADKFYALFTQDKVVGERALGKGKVMAIRSGELLSELNKFLERGITIYERPIR
jgi:aminoglycoside 3-N-acetyltransferase